ncbi:NADP oxidoreductase [Brachybacterium phenoliresistens]|uniref:NADP oxidoreductase n=2 Tax=Brachybacterium phenoliresistens TaxID=396014 RepID=Z9JRA2_9MICO|nr:NAD(P)-binding domain-containing protein [Brachybacterium phenoliresistens]EWS80920.1 NADP oxidoreductase [Brachybacterium phenoliresistens]
MTRLGIIGSGSIGAGLASLASAAGHDVRIANSRGPESLAGLVAELGPGVQAATVEEAAAFGDLTILAVPLSAYGSLPIQELSGRTVLSTGNYYPSRDGRIPELDSLDLTTAEYESTVLPGAVIVKAFNNIVAHHIPSLARPAEAQDRSGMAVFGDSTEAKQLVAQVIGDLGFDAVDCGPLAESWRTEPESGAYTLVYAADSEGFSSDYTADPGAPVPADRLRELVAASTRAKVAEREF